MAKDKKTPPPPKVPPRTPEEMTDYWTTKPGDLIPVDLDPRDEPTHNEK